MNILKKDYNEILWKCRRGTLELDIVLRNFLNKKYRYLNKKEQILFRNLLDEQDQLLQFWFLKERKKTSKLVASLIKIICTGM